MITRIVLAAGRGQRMGSIKALLDFEGRSALALIADLRLPAPFRTVVVTGHAHEEVAAEASACGLNVVRNQAWEAGQTGSLQSGLSFFPDPSEAWLLHPVDLPLIRQDDYDAAWDAYSSPGAAADSPRIAATSYAMRRGHPIIFDSSVAKELSDLGPDDSARPVFARHQNAIRHAVRENPWVRRDLDHPEDYAEALEVFRSR